MEVGRGGQSGGHRRQDSWTHGRRRGERGGTRAQVDTYLTPLSLILRTMFEHIFEGRSTAPALYNLY